MFLEELGFSRVIDLIVKSKTPIVGHNMIYDLAFMYHQFIADLPPTFIEYATSWN
jgi:poly(A)-specific ribonuclease